MSAIFEKKPPAQEDVLGALSLIVWSITLVVIVKYVIFILMADDHGEGGAFAMCSLLSRGLRRRIEDDAKFEWWNGVVYGVALVSAASAFGDGVLTPAISVLSAVEGLAVPSPDLATAVIPITMAILFVLFMIQRFGTRRVSQLSAPVITLWLFSLFAIGIYNVRAAPEVFEALNPGHAFGFFIRNGRAGWIQLGAVVLCITGVEALYADLGHFSRPAIRLSCIAITYPCILLAYMGQAAQLYVNPALIENTFYLTLPSVTYYPMLVLATLATIIASQAMISASFSIIHQAVRLQSFPRVTVVHTDEHSEGQVYVPVMNYFLMVACLLVVLIFQTSSALATAYGVAVCFNMLIDSAAYAAAIRIHFNKPIVYSVLFFLCFGLIDATFLTANLNKFLSGGWFPIALAVVLSAVMFVWRWGRLRLVAQLRTLSVPYGGNLSHELRALATAAQAAEGNWWERDIKSRPRRGYSGITGGNGGAGGGGGDDDDDGPTAAYASLADDTMAPLPDTVPIANSAALYDARPQMPGVYFFYTSISDAVPAAFVHMVRLLPIRPEHLIFVTIDVVNLPRVESLMKFGPVPGLPGVYRAVVIIGYMETPPIAARLAPRLLRALLAVDATVPVANPQAVPTGHTHASLPEVRDAAAGTGSGSGSGSGAAFDAVDPAAWSDADLLAQYQPTFLMGRDRVASPFGAGYMHRALVELFSWEMKLSRTILATMRIPPTRVLEVGFVVEI